MTTRKRGKIYELDSSQLQVQKNTQDIAVLTQSVQDRDDALSKKIDSLVDSVTPMVESYKAAVTMGKWISGGLVFVSILIGVIIGFRQAWISVLSKLFR